MTQNVTASYRLPADLRDRVRAAAEERVIGPNLLVAKALEAYLDALPPIPEVRLQDVTPSPPLPAGPGHARWSTAHDSHRIGDGVTICSECGIAITDRAIDIPCPQRR